MDATMHQPHCLGVSLIRGDEEEPLAQRRSWSVLPLPSRSLRSQASALWKSVWAQNNLPCPSWDCLCLNLLVVGLLVPKDNVIDAIRVVGDLVVRLPDLGAILCASNSCWSWCHIMVLLIDDISECFLSVLMRFGGVIGQFVLCVDRCLMPWFDLWLLFYVVGHIWFCLVDVHERIKLGS
jgi:hypothetical protein